jgi:hypothetical protein
MAHVKHRRRCEDIRHKEPEMKDLPTAGKVFGSFAFACSGIFLALGLLFRKLAKGSSHSGQECFFYTGLACTIFGILFFIFDKGIEAKLKESDVREAAKNKARRERFHEEFIEKTVPFQSEDERHLVALWDNPRYEGIVRRESRRLSIRQKLKLKKSRRQRR